MKEIHVTCPQCGQEDGYFEYEQGDLTGVNPVIFQRPWKCRFCGYPEVNWNNYTNVSIPKVIVNFKITDAQGNVIREYYE